MPRQMTATTPATGRLAAVTWRAAAATRRRGIGLANNVVVTAMSLFQRDCHNHDAGAAPCGQMSAALEAWPHHYGCGLTLAS